MNRHHYAVVVGINWYPGIPNRRLVHARQDAVAFHHWLTNSHEGGVPGGQARLIIATDDEEGSYRTVDDNPQPLRGQVNGALRDFHKLVDGLRPNEWEQTRLYLYVAGHGVAPDQGRGALLFADSEPRGYWGDHLDLGRYEAYYERCSLFREVVLLADCCRTIDFGIPPASEPPFGKCPGSRPTRRVLGYATTISREAKEPNKQEEADQGLDGRGYFTRALLEGLRGQAPHDRLTGAIDRPRLATYVRERVAQLSGNFAQEAELLGSDDLIFARVPVELYDVEVIVTEGWLTPLEIRRDEILVASWSPGEPTPWRMRLTNGVYEVFPTGRPDLEERAPCFKVAGHGRNVVI